jgi:lysophospholipase L1-like esterase
MMSSRQLGSPSADLLFCRALRTSRHVSRHLALSLASLAVGCGGGSPTGPGPTPTPGFPVSGFVFYDENANGIADPSEVVRLPGVSVSIGGKTAVTSAGGRYTVDDVPSGAQPASALPATLPAYFASGTALSVSVPGTGDLAIPATLTLGARARPNVYLAFGDSITWGEGSSDLSGYRGYLQSSLRSYWGKAGMYASGSPGTRSDDGEQRAVGVLADYRPAYLLILYGTNDWNDPKCRDWFPCFTIDSLRAIAHHARDAGAKPVLGTIPPVNPDYADKNAAGRNAWVKRMNEAIRAMAKEEQLPVADVYGEFSSQSSLAPLFSDFVHPNDAGYRLIAKAFFAAITGPYSSSSASSTAGFFTFERRR